MENENQTTTEQDDGFLDFAAAFGDDIDYQTDNDTSSEEEEDSFDFEAAEDDDTTETDDGGKEHQEEEKPDSAASEQHETHTDNQDKTFTIKVNKSDKTVSREEVISLAQKGADYDRVRQQRDEMRTEMESLQKYKGYEGILDMLAIISEGSKMTPEELMDSMYINMRRGQGMDETAAKEALRADKLEKKISVMEKKNEQKEAPKDDGVDRVKTEISEFRQQYPDVQITEDLMETLSKDIQSGTSLLRAYEKMKNAEALAAEKNRADELERQLNAERQNKRNRKSSPGSQKDSGGKRVESDFDAFSKALFG